MLSMFHPGQNLLLCGTIAFQPISDELSRHVPTPFEHPLEELPGGCLMAATPHEHSETIPALIHRSPQIMPLAVDREEDVVQVPLVARLATSAPQLIAVRLTKLPRPLADRLIRNEDPTGTQQLFDIAIAEAEAKLQPHSMADDLGCGAVVLVSESW
jgi:hypothetical protein